jgi:hypothetical protein
MFLKHVEKHVEKWTLAYRRFAIAKLTWFEEELDRLQNQNTIYAIMLTIKLLGFIVMSLPFLIYFKCREEFFLNHPDVILDHIYRANERNWVLQVFREPPVKKVNWKRDGF